MTADPLVDDELVLHGRVMPASNATFVGSIGEHEVVYKPVAGERPLWDFPGAVLAHREVAAFEVSEAFGGLGEHPGVVPPTWLREGPHGEGMVQLWREPVEEDSAVTLVPEGQVPSGWCHVFDGYDASDRCVSLVHEDTPELRWMAVLDVVLNNADRKGGHVLEMPGGHRHGIDHGIAFHTEPKLRTVLWGWMGSALTDAEREAVTRVRVGLAGALGEALRPLLTAREVDALGRRCDRLLSHGVLPAPRGEGPAIPWPPF